MRIAAGFELAYECEHPTPMVLMLSPHPSRTPDLLSDAGLCFSPRVIARDFTDAFGNRCHPHRGAGRHHDDLHPLRDARQRTTRRGRPARRAASDRGGARTRRSVFLQGSRYCETDRLMDVAWSRFGSVAPGWARVQAVCDFVHHHIIFDYQAADATRTAVGALEDGIGVCRDYTHLAVALCRCLNIPARYCTGYLGDIGIPPVPDPMDFSAWFEVWLGGRWYTFDARHNRPRIGRILMATGRDATDVALSTSYGSARLVRFEVVTDEIAEEALARLAS